MFWNVRSNANPGLNSKGVPKDLCQIENMASMGGWVTRNASPVDTKGDELSLPVFLSIFLLEEHIPLLFSIVLESGFWMMHARLLIQANFKGSIDWLRCRNFDMLGIRNRRNKVHIKWLIICKRAMEKTELQEIACYLVATITGPRESRHGQPQWHSSCPFFDDDSFWVEHEK